MSLIINYFKEKNQQPFFVKKNSDEHMYDKFLKIRSLNSYSEGSYGSEKKRHAHAYTFKCRHMTYAL